MDTDDELDFNRALELEAEAEEDDFADIPPLEDEDGSLSYNPLCKHRPGFKAVSLSPGLQVGALCASQSSSSSSPSVATSSAAVAATPARDIQLPLQSTPSQLLRLSPQDVGEPGRKRLRGKTRVAVVAEPVLRQTADGIWENYFAMSWKGHRQKYFWVYNKFRHWIGARAESLTEEEKQGDGKVYVQASVRFKDLESPVKHSIMQEFLAATSAPQELRRWAHTVWPNDLSTTEKKERYVCYSKQVLWTWQGEWGVLAADLVEAGVSWRVAVNKIGAAPAFLQLWDEFCSFHVELVSRLQLRDWGISAELCVESWVVRRTVRVHFHAYWKSDSKIYVPNMQPIVFKGSCPNKSYTIAGMHQRATTGWAGLYYVSCPKIGMICNECSAAAFTGYPVSGEWVFSLVQSRKMETTDARSELIKVGKGIVRKLADLDKIVQMQKEERVNARVVHVQAVIEASNLAFKKFPAIEVWRTEARRPYQRRKKFLVLEGPTGLGKTEYVKPLFGVARTLELNCANCGNYPNLRGHDPDVHDCVLFDEGTMGMVLSNRKLFQAPASWVDFGHSPTGRDVYRVFLGDSVIVISSNKWSEEYAKLTLESDRNWITENQVLVYVTGPMFAA